MPIKKFQTAGIAGALGTVIVWLAGVVGIEMTQEVATAIGVIVAVVAGYLQRDPIVDHGRQWQEKLRAKK